MTATLPAHRCGGLIRFPEDWIRTERVRGFQPPWRTVYILRCPACKEKSKLRRFWKGPAPSFGIYCPYHFMVSS